MPTATAPSSSPHPFLSSFFTSPPLQQTPDEHSAAQRLVRITSSKSSLNDSEQRFSAAFQSDEQRSRGPTSPFVAPHHQDVVVSASPAAMFLSAFCSPVIQQRSPDEEGEVVAGYTLADIIGYGAFSTIRRAYSTSGGIVAVKIVRRSDLAKQEHTARMRLENEEAVWSSLSHEHILPLFTSLHTSYADFYVTLYCPAGSLFDILKRDGTPALPQDDVGMMFRQVVRGLRYLHEIALFVHRDIKLENILVDEMGICRIGDFGMTRKVGESEEEIDEDDEHQEFFQQQQHGGVHRAVSLAVPSAKYIHSHLTPRNPGGLRHRNSTSSAKPQFPLHNCQPGSLPYAAPELLSRQTASHLLPHPAQDIWALGVMLYALLTGRLPFSDSFEPRLQMKILNGVFDLPTDIGRGAERVLKGCMERSVEKRWTIAMVDEVAWGVGWGPEGDQVTPMTENEEDEFEQIPTTRKSSAAPSRSQSRHKPSRRRFDDDHGGDDADVFPETPEWQMEDTMRSRSAMEAASRRSTSRVERSMSRAPITSSRRHSRVRAAPTSRAASPPPSSATFNKKLSVDPSLPSPTTSSSSTTSSSASSPFDDSSFLGMSPLPLPHIKTTMTTTGTGAAVERGRRAKPQYYSHSRSPSPSIPPSTPVDLSSSLSSVVRFTSPDPASRQRESSRGRRRRGVMYEQHQQHPHPRSRQRRGVQPFQPGVGQLLSSTTDALEELDVLDERGGWNEEGGSDVDEKEHEKDEGEEEEGILSPLRDLRETDEWVQVHHEHDLHHHEHHHDEHESVGPLPNTRRRVSPVRRTRTGHGRHRRPESTPPAMMKVPSPSGWSSSLLSSSYAGYSATTSSSRYYHAQKGRQGQGHGHGWGGHHRYRQPSPPPPPTPCLLVQMPSWMESSSQMQGQSQTHLGGRGRSEKRGGGFDDGASPNVGGNANSGNAQQQWGRVGRVGGRSGIVRSRSLGYEPRKEEAYLLRCV